MYCTTQVGRDLYYVGASDRRLALFENIYPLTNGVSYNSYVLCDEKTVVFDTVDSSVGDRFFENLEYVLNGRSLDYLIVNHMEPDHCATMGELVLRYPDIKIVGNQKTLAMIKQFFNFDVSQRFVTVTEGSTLETGTHTLAFAMAPMVHWPEAMVTYDATEKILFSADAFGTFGALSGNIFADCYSFERDILPEARRYYTNIVGKYGNQVQALLKKASKLDIKMICPLHGPVWRKNIGDFIDKYVKWSTYTPEENAVMIAYGSIYGGTQNAAEILANELADRGVRNIAVYDVSVTDPSYIVSEAFRCSHLVFASSTYNAGIFSKMETALLDIKAHNLQNRTVAFIENGTWAATSGELMRGIFASMKNINALENKVSFKSRLKQEQLDGIKELADEICGSMFKKAAADETVKLIDNEALFKISYGLFVLTAKNGSKDNGCIINTAMLVTDNPKQLMIAVNKANLTHDMLLETKVCNLSVLTCDVPFKVFEHFGFVSGTQTDKFAGSEYNDTAENGVKFVKDYSNAVISAEVTATTVLCTHTVFTLTVTSAKKLSDAPSVTYDYYLKHIKPKPQVTGEKKKGWVCKICGYVYEGESLPADFICPLCKHGIEDFEPLN